MPLSTLVDIQMRPQANRLPQFDQMNAVTLSVPLTPGLTMGRAVDFCRTSRRLRAPRSTGCRIAASSSRKATAWPSLWLRLDGDFPSAGSAILEPARPAGHPRNGVAGRIRRAAAALARLRHHEQLYRDRDDDLIGLIPKQGILMVALADDIQKHEGLGPMAAMHKTAIIRMRPVLMATAAMVAGLVPLLFAAGRAPPTVSRSGSW